VEGAHGDAVEVAQTDSGGFVLDYHVRSVQSGLADRYENATGFVYADWIGFDPAVAEQGGTGFQVEFPSVKGTDQRGPAYEAIGQGAAAMGAVALNGKDFAGTGMKDGDVLSEGIETAAFAGWDRGQSPDFEFRHRHGHESTGSSGSNSFAAGVE
jgi:hypothetical protein